MGTTIRWTYADIIDATLEHWGCEDYQAEDCEVITSALSNGSRCLVVLHVPTGRTSDESGNAGRWNLDGSPYAPSS
jgi:hypothetical protein